MAETIKAVINSKHRPKIQVSVLSKKKKWTKHAGTHVFHFISTLSLASAVLGVKLQVPGGEYLWKISILPRCLCPLLLQSSYAEILTPRGVRNSRRRGLWEVARSWGSVLRSDPTDLLAPPGVRDAAGRPQPRTRPGPHRCLDPCASQPPRTSLEQ